MKIRDIKIIYEIIKKRITYRIEYTIRKTKFIIGKNTICRLLLNDGIKFRKIYTTIALGFMALITEDIRFFNMR